MMTMTKFLRYSVIIALTTGSILFVSSCKDFLNPEQALNITDDRLYDDWYEYRAVAMGLYGLQQKLVEQLVILGELRADLLKVTENANADLIEIYNFKTSKTNPYASPVNFYKLIASCNNFIHILKEKHPEVQDSKKAVTNYDKLYGEVLCMRAWAYFNAVRIYGKVPYFPESLTTIEEIQEYVNSEKTYTDKIDITFSSNGYFNDTIYNKPVVLQKQYLNQKLVIDMFTNQLETEIKAVGVNHYIDNNDATWEVTIWNSFALHALLGIMYLTDGDYTRAASHYNQIMYFSSDNYRYQIDASFANANWQNIFKNIDSREHIFTIWYNKSYQQQNSFQQLFEKYTPHKYMLKPTRACIMKWETIWDNYTIIENASNPAKSRIGFRGLPGDFSRGYNVSYGYVSGDSLLSSQSVRNMLNLRALGDDRSASLIMQNADTVVYKYSIGKRTYDQDANFLLYRAAGIHLYMAEIYTWWAFNQNGLIRTFTNNAIAIVNNGSNFDPIQTRIQQGVRGRVGFGGTVDGIKVGNINYIHNPFTNEIEGYTNLTGDLYAKQLYLEEQIMDERARELAFEGERFYDLMRAAKRRNDPTYLAKLVSAKFPEGKKQAIYNLLLDEKNWYIKYFE
jgi:starch-binding outer membrane protein, SusD/RagB family